MSANINHVGIAGGGKMGGSLFNYLTEFGFSVTWHNRSNAEKSKDKYHRKLSRQLRNNIISEDHYNKKISTIHFSDSIESLSEAQIVVECISEDLSAKREIVNRLERVLTDTAVIASCSSSILPDEIISSEKGHERIIGLHFFYPVEFKNIVEFIFTGKTNSGTIQKAENFLRLINRSFIKQDNESAFLLNKIMLEIQAAAYRLKVVDNLSYSAIDKAVRESMLPIGIFEMIDHIGIDLLYASIKNYLKNTNNTDAYDLLILQLDYLIDNNKLGIKTDSGFYNYTTEDSFDCEDHVIDSKPIVDHLKGIYFKAFDDIVSRGLCKSEVLEFAMNEYLETDTGKWR